MSQTIEEIEAAKAIKNAEGAQKLQDLFDGIDEAPAAACCGGTTFFDNSKNPNACEYGKPRKPWLQANYSCGTQAGDALGGADYPEDISNTVITVKEQNMRP